MIKGAAIVFGLVFLTVGILGFVPAATREVHGMPLLLGVFHVNGPHNAVHLASGIFLLGGLSGPTACRFFFRIFGLVYALVAVLGFLKPEGPLLGLISSNVADTWLHVGLATVMLIIGFAFPAERVRP